ncbi:MAG TPA: DegT/DnrJ/EryC1/StrS family aminotransferase [Trueperaceae bacterium]
MIPVTRPYLPERERLDRRIDGIFERQWLTNNGELVQELTKRLEGYLGVENLLLVSNGTLALQIAYRALGLSQSVGSGPPEAITTPFTFVATASSLKWEGIEPVFTDIDPYTWCLAPNLVEAAVTSRTRAIVPVHVFGNACDVEKIDDIGRRLGLKVVYDAAHAFGVNHNGRSLLDYGDASILSFHATKLFHTIEGGAIVFRRKEDFVLAKKLINFGITGPESIEGLGINAKMNEFQAAMGLCVLEEIDTNLNGRRIIWEEYVRALGDRYQLQQRDTSSNSNYAYVPLLLPNESDVITAQEILRARGIETRRYFYPSLDTVEYLPLSLAATHSADVSRRVLCLPIYFGMPIDVVSVVVDVLDRVSAT